MKINLYGLIPGVIGRTQLLRGLRSVAAKVCVYSRPGVLAKTCDCKYDPKPDYPENSGCPEVRAALTLFSVMTDREFLMLKRRIGVVMENRR